MISKKDYRNREIINQGDYYKTNYLGDTTLVKKKYNRQNNQKIYPIYLGI